MENLVAIGRKVQVNKMLPLNYLVILVMLILLGWNLMPFLTISIRPLGTIQAQRVAVGEQRLRVKRRAGRA